LVGAARDPGRRDAPDPGCHNAADPGCHEAADPGRRDAPDPGRLDRDILAGGTSSIIDTTVAVTVVGGQVAHRSEGSP
jgi:hypothetical protein